MCLCVSFGTVRKAWCAMCQATQVRSDCIIWNGPSIKARVPSNTITSPAGAVTKYRNEHVCVCVCVSCLSVREDMSRSTCAIFTYFFCACCPWPWLGPFPVGWRNPMEKGQFWRFSFPLTMHSSATKGRFRLNLLIYCEVGQNSISYY